LLLAVEVAQTAVGLIQANLGLPAVLVGIHMVLACVLASVMTAVVLNLKQPVVADAPPAPRAPAESLAR